MAIDEKGFFASSQALGNWDGGSVQRITPIGTVPALLLSSDYPIAIGRDGGLYYVPYNKAGRRELVRRMPDGKRSVFATLPTDTGPNPMLWVNGIAAGPDGSLFVTDNDAVRRIDGKGKVSTVRDGIELRDCIDALLDTPKLPYFRGLALADDGTIYVAANGCRTVVSIPVKGAVKTVLTAEQPWSPTGIVISGGATYVLEYIHTPGEDRKEWVPRVRRITNGGDVQTLVRINR